MGIKIATLIILVINLLIVHKNALLDFNLISNKKYIDHGIRAFIYYLIIMFLVTIVLYLFNEASLYNIITYMILCFSIRWIYFDLTLNKLRKLPLDYISNKKNNNSNIDTLMYPLKKYQFIIKFVTLIISIICVIH
jgi:hypothetical protein